MYVRILFVVAALELFILPAAASSPTVEDVRGILYLCSQGYSKSKGAAGGIEIDALSLSIIKGIKGEAELQGQIDEKEVGAILEKTFTEQGSLEAYRLYQSCLNRHLSNFMAGRDLPGPGVQRTATVTLVTQDAQIIDNIAIVVISATFHRGTVGWYQLEPSTFKAVSSAGGVFSLIDAGGLDRGFRPDAGDNVSMTLIFERMSGSTGDKKERYLNVSGSLDRYVNTKTRHTTAVGLRDIPVRG